MNFSIFALVCLSLLVLVFWGAIRSENNELKLLGQQKARDEARPDHERQLLTEGIDDSWMKQSPREIAQSAGNVVFLAWLLRTEKKYRDFRGTGTDQYPPDWKWRKAFVLLRDSFKCTECGIGKGEGLPLDCHHKVPICKYPQGKPGIHGLSNLITLCPNCHAGKHPENARLQERARKLQERAERWREYRSREKPRRSRLPQLPWYPTISLESLTRPAETAEEVVDSDNSTAKRQVSVLHNKSQGSHSSKDAAGASRPKVSELEVQNWPRLSEDVRESVLTEFKKIQDQGLFQPIRNFPPNSSTDEAVEQRDSVAGGETGAVEPDVPEEAGVAAALEERPHWPGGVVTISVDAAKLLIPEYLKDPIRNDRMVTSAAKAISQSELATVLATLPEPGREMVLIAAGSPGSGKTATLAPDGDETVGLKIETNLDDLESARALVLQIIDSGRRPIILWVYVDDPAKTVDRMFKRAVKIGRTDHLDDMAKAYATIPQVISRLGKEFAGRLKIHVADNSGAKGEEIFIEDSSRAWSPLEDALATRAGLAQVDGTNRMFRENPTFEVSH
ncbi:MAG TPA: HNH endonuclease [Terracidiphilus sp.]|nr:HNH endonuclease [Terracidiphilus sp.]